MIATERLVDHLDAIGLGTGDPVIAPIGEGHSNLTFLVDRGGERFILRRPPLGKLARSANDVIREARVLAALAGSEVPVPAVLSICEDPEVIGAPFFLAEFVPGHVVTTRLPKTGEDLDGGLIADRLVDTIDKGGSMEFETYRDRYQTVALERDGRGVLELRLHTEGGPWQMSRETHHEVTDAFREVGLDEANEVVIITGTGDTFSGPPSTPIASRYDTATWEWRRDESAALIENYLAIPVPVISAINGPAPRQAQIVLLADIVLAAESATFEDSAHFPNDVVPGASIGVAMMALLGLNRGRYFLLTGEELTATEAYEVGLVAEVLPATELLPRAREHAAGLLAKTPLVRRYTRTLLNQELRRRMFAEVGYGLALEGTAVIDSTKGNA